MSLHHAAYPTTRPHSLKLQYPTPFHAHSWSTKYLMRFHFSSTGHPTAPSTIWTSSHSHISTVTSPAQQLQAQLDRTLAASIQTTTANQYQHHWQSFRNFVSQQLQQQPQLPSQTNHICLFIVHLANTGLSLSTIRTYLSAIAFVHKMRNHPDPTTAFIITKTLQGIKNTSAMTPDKRLPITKPILHQLLQSLTYAVTTNYDQTLWRSIFLLAYHACLRAGELTLSKNPSNVLQLSQVSIAQDHITIQFTSYKHSNGRTPLITIQSQPPGQPCPVDSLRRYLTVRRKNPGHLFINQDASPVTIQQFSAVLHTTASLSSLPPNQYSTHSFRIGKATQMASDGHTE